ncbi:ADP-ribosylglycohydrolase family protein [Stigmatella sp. ncwal1]|uniref:ADP-ribosylglycohydrolase family protein n=1 Tax=Stigmatella ashevillensis TaxID=2995309 RepID=A0ABT5D3Z4_9BACT|nr:ADP-ribosylglycohydrolase family protein [Stigmatella ashevillena]MDC0708390.1 ADP-ribosylglycohydrolase family protein [Stigmatella ashevillena]
MPTHEQRLAGGVYGLLIGDALGVPYEFHPPAQIPPPEQIEFEPPSGFHRAHAGVLPGTWSDDGAHAHCLLASLLYRGQLDVEDLGRRLVNWFELGYMAVGGQVFDVGIQTRSALTSFREGVSGLESGPRGEKDNGNGSLMRVLPLALWHAGSDEALAADAMRQSLVTHGHLRSQVCCALYCLWARRTLEEVADPWDAAVASFHRLFPPGTAAREELDTQVRPHTPEAGKGSGYVVDCLLSARDCVRRGSTYEQVVKAAVALGHDTDTTAAVAGGIAGVRDGIEAIPGRWLAALRDRDAVEPMVTALRELRGRRPSSPQGG